MSFNVFTTLPSYFSPAEVGEMLAKAIGLSNLKELFAIGFGSSGVVGNVFLRNVSVYRFFEAYNKGILKRDMVLIVGAINTAISDAAMATLLSTMIYEAFDTAFLRAVIKFDFLGAVFGNFFVNYLSLIMLEAHLFRDEEALKKYEQRYAFSCHLYGRSVEETKTILLDFINFNGAGAFSINDDQQGGRNSDNLLAECENFSEPDFDEKIEDYCKRHGLWDGQSTLYEGMSKFGRGCGILAAISLFKNNFSLYLNDLHLPSSAAIPLAILPIPPKGALYDRSWAQLLRYLRHAPDTVRNSLFLARENKRYLLFLVPASLLVIYLAPSGAGFYLVGKGFLDFMWDSVFNIKDAPTSVILLALSWLLKGVITSVGLMTNESALLSALSLFAGKAQDYLFPDENKEAKFFGQKAQAVLDTTMPTTTVMERACTTTVGRGICTTASAIGSWIYTAASYCAPSSLEGSGSLVPGGPGYGSFSFFSTPSPTRNRPWSPSILSNLLPKM